MRTFQTGAAFGQTPAQSAAYAMNKNMPKYQNVIQNFVPPARQAPLANQLREYHSAMSAGAGKPNIPGSTSELQSWMNSAGSPAYNNTLMKAAGVTPIAPYVKLFEQARTGAIMPEAFRRVLRSVVERNQMTKVPSRTMRDALMSMNMKPEEMQGFLNDIKSRNMPTTSSIMGKFFENGGVGDVKKAALRGLAHWVSKF